jgi:hypothetical protein
MFLLQRANAHVEHGIRSHGVPADSKTIPSPDKGWRHVPSTPKALLAMGDSGKGLLSRLQNGALEALASVSPLAVLIWVLISAGVCSIVLILGPLSTTIIGWWRKNENRQARRGWSFDTSLNRTQSLSLQDEDSMASASSISPTRQPLREKPRAAVQFDARTSTMTNMISAQNPSIPPMCPDILVKCSTIVGIALEDVVGFPGTGELLLKGLSGQPMLRVVISDDAGLRELKAFTLSDRRHRILIKRSALGALEIYTKEGSSYGFLDVHENGGCFVIHNGERIITVEGESSQTLKLSVLDSEGFEAANVICKSDFPGGAFGKEYIIFEVEPLLDSILISTVVLTLLLASHF